MSALKLMDAFQRRAGHEHPQRVRPLVLMFLVNAMYGITAGTWALIISTVVAIASMFLVLSPAGVPAYRLRRYGRVSVA